MATVRRFNLSLVCVIVLALASCSKKDEAPMEPGAFLQQYKLLQSIPDTAVGFVVWNNESAASKRFAASPWSTTTSQVSDSFMSAQLYQGDSVPPAVKDLSSIVVPLLKEAEATQEGVVFLDTDASGKPFPGLFAISGEQPNFSKLADELLKGLKEGNRLAIKDLELAGSKLSFQVANKDHLNFPVVVAADQHRLAIVSDQALAARFFSGSGQGLPTVAKSDQAMRLAKAANTDLNQLVFGYLDTATLFKRAANSIQANQQLDVDNIPLEALAFSRSMGATLTDNLVLSLVPRSDTQRKVIAALKNVGKVNPTKHAPQNVSALISINNASMGEIRRAMLQELPAEQRQQLEPRLQLLDSLEGLTVVVSQGQPGTPFPDLATIWHSQDPQMVLGQLKTLLSPVVSSGFFPAGWQEQEIAGTPTSFLASPMGVGIYLGAMEQGVVISSSSIALQQIIAPTTSGLEAVISKDFSNELQQLPLASAYVNFNQLVDLAKSLTGTIAMFSGGQAGTDTAQLEKLRQIGQVLVTATTKDDLFMLKSRYAEASSK